MDNPQLNDDLIDKAIEAARNFTADSIPAFRALGDLDAAVVIRVIRQDEEPARPPRARRRDAGKPRAPKPAEKV